MKPKKKRPVMKILVCGSRDYENHTRIYQVLDKYRISYSELGRHLLIISGGAGGADNHAMKWAMSRKVDHLIMYARWDQEGRAAGALRNRRMAKQKPDLVIGFSDDFSKSVGTTDMLNHAKSKGIPTKRYH